MGVAYRFEIAFDEQPKDDEAATHWLIDMTRDLEDMGFVVLQHSLKRVDDSGKEHTVDVAGWWEKWVTHHSDAGLRREEAAKMQPQPTEVEPRQDEPETSQEAS